MRVETPIREPASARSTVDDSAFDESATRAPVEVLIKEHPAPIGR